MQAIDTERPLLRGINHGTITLIITNHTLATSDKKATMYTNAKYEKGEKITNKHGRKRTMPL